VFDLDQVRLGCVPVVEDPADPFEPTCPVGGHAGRVGQRRPQLVQDPQAGLGAATAHDFGPHQPFEPVLTEPAGPSEITPVTAHQHAQGGDPGDRLERLLRSGQGCRPHALEQVPNLLHAPGMGIE